MNTLRLGTRGSQLALWQARTAASLIEEAGGPRCEIVVIRTSGDRLAEAPLSEVGGKRLFVKEIEDALLGHQVDLAVHSCKDMPAVLPEGLAIGAILPREDPRDAVVLPEDGPGRPDSLESLLHVLKQQPLVGTSSVRRVAQLLRLMPAARFLPIRGNLDTRLRKLDAGGFDALVLAAAGMRRLGFAARVSLMLPVDACVPAPGQGAVALEVRVGDEPTRELVGRVNDPLAWSAVAAERALVADLGGGCQVPIGALATPEDDALDLQAVVVSLDGRRAVRARARGKAADAAGLGRRVAAHLLGDGAGAILDEVRGAQGPAGGLQP